MAGVPSLYDLCLGVIADLLRGEENNHILSGIYEIPPELFEKLLPHLPPLALQTVEKNLPVDFRDNFDCPHNDIGDCRKRRRLEGKIWSLDKAWQALYKVRWPGTGQHKQGLGWLDKHDEAEYNSIAGWHQRYWEAHLQDCVDAITETALLPSYDGSIGEIQIPDVILGCIGCKGHQTKLTRGYLNFSCHCQQFGLYARKLRLPNALCVAEICDLLQSSKLHALELQWIKSHVEGLCKLLNQKCETLKSIELIHCKLSPSLINAICGSLRMKGLREHEVEHFSVKRSSFLQIDSSPTPIGLISFLTSGRSLKSITLCDDQLGRNFAREIFNTLLNASAPISVLDLSENDISGFLSQFLWRSSSCSPEVANSLQSVRVLNLRLCSLLSDDVYCLKRALVWMPNLENLDLSDNLIGNGIWSLVSYLSEISSRDLPFSDLKLENCELTCNQVIKLLSVLSTLKKPLNLLSLKGNRLGSKIGAPLGKFLLTGVRALDVEDIGLDSLGFCQALEEITKDLKIGYINISDNPGGIAASNFLLRLISHANNIVAIDARYDLMPMESLTVILSGLKASKVKLEHLDLSGNSLCDQLGADRASILEEFGIDRQFNLLLSSAAPNAPYDDDP